MTAEGKQSSAEAARALAIANALHVVDTHANDVLEGGPAHGDPANGSCLCCCWVCEESIRNVALATEAEERQRYGELVSALEEKARRARTLLFDTDECTDYDKHQDANEDYCEPCNAKLWGEVDMAGNVLTENVNSLLYDIVREARAALAVLSEEGRS